MKQNTAKKCFSLSKPIKYSKIETRFISCRFFDSKSTADIYITYIILFIINLSKFISMRNNAEK